MSKFAWILVAAAMAFTTAAAARAIRTDVAHVSSVRLGTDVILEGYIVQHIRDDYFKFQDGTGSVRIELDRWASRGRTPAPDVRVRIYGEVERGWSARYVSVERMTVLP